MKNYVIIEQSINERKDYATVLYFSSKHFTFLTKLKKETS